MGEHEARFSGYLQCRGRIHDSKSYGLEVDLAERFLGGNRGSDVASILAIALHCDNERCLDLKSQTINWAVLCDKKVEASGVLNVNRFWCLSLLELRQRDPLYKLKLVG